ncbi:hypothetical protein [Shinella zoogloeoides]
MTGNELLQVAIDKLSLAAEGQNVLLSCSDGLHALIKAASLGSLDPALYANAQRLLFATAPRVAAETVGRLAPEHIYHSLGCANAALTCVEPDRYIWLLASARVLASELIALHLRDLVMSCNQIDLAHAIACNPLAAAAFQTGPMTNH